MAKKVKNKSFMKLKKKCSHVIYTKGNDLKAHLANLDIHELVDSCNLQRGIVGCRKKSCPLWEKYKRGEL